MKIAALRKSNGIKLVSPAVADDKEWMKVGWRKLVPGAHLELTGSDS